jgi:hypothetical protein
VVVVDEPDLEDLRPRLLKKISDFDDVVNDPDMGLEQIRLAAKPLLKALRDL